MEKGSLTIYRKNLKIIPDNEFWQYSLKLYVNEGVSQACILLQDQFLLNVNMLLVCCWFAASGRGSIKKQELNHLITLIDPWHEKITHELRSLRRKITIKELRDQTLQLEIYSEKAQQAILYDYLCAYHKLRRSPSQKIKDVLNNMQGYFSLAKIVLNEAGYEATRIILASGFEGFRDNDFPQLNLNF